MRLLLSLVVPLLSLALPGCGGAQPSDPNAPLVLERAIALPNTRGRIDHLAIDLESKRLFVAEIAQGAVDEVDLGAGKVVGRIGGLSGPQGVAWLPKTRELVVASEDGTVRFYGTDLKERARIALGRDADNVRVDPRNGHVVVGYGDGGLAVIDPVAHRALSRLALPGHPEGFQLSGGRAYINVPDAGAVISADIDRQEVLARWPTGLHRLNFPMALSPDGSSISIAYRFPAAVATIDTRSGRATRILPTCGDADDIFQRDDRLMVVCGAGRVGIMTPENGMAQVVTRKGARTGLFVPELQRLIVAVPAGDRSAEIWVLKPN